MSTISNADIRRIGPLQKVQSYLNGAKFSTPSSEMVDTRAIGLGTTPLIMSAYSLLNVECDLAKSSVAARVHATQETAKWILRGILFCGGDGLPPVFLPFHPFPTIGCTVDFLAPRPGRVGWACVLAAEVTIEGGQGHLVLGMGYF